MNFLSSFLIATAILGSSAVMADVLVLKTYTVEEFIFTDLKITEQDAKDLRNIVGLTKYTSVRGETNGKGLHSVTDLECSSKACRMTIRGGSKSKQALDEITEEFGEGYNAAIIGEPLRSLKDNEKQVFAPDGPMDISSNDRSSDEYDIVNKILESKKTVKEKGDFGAKAATLTSKNLEIVAEIEGGWYRLRVRGIAK